MSRAQQLGLHSQLRLLGPGQAGCSAEGWPWAGLRASVCQGSLAESSPWHSKKSARQGSPRGASPQTRLLQEPPRPTGPGHHGNVTEAPGSPTLTRAHSGVLASRLLPGQVTRSQLLLVRGSLGEPAFSPTRPTPPAAADPVGWTPPFRGGPGCVQFILVHEGAGEEGTRGSRGSILRCVGRSLGAFTVLVLETHKSGSVLEGWDGLTPSVPE